MDYLNNLLFGYYPYVAGTVFLVGSVVRFDMSQYTWKSGSSQIMDNSRSFRWASNLFHVGFILLFFGHLIGLLMPHWLYPYLGLNPSSKQVLAMTAGGIFGTMILIGGGMLLVRRLTQPRVRAQGSNGDLVILALLYVQLILGLLTIPVSAAHLDGAEMLLLADWAQHIVTFRPGAAAFVASVPLIFKIHLVLGMTIFLVFPFTRLVHIWSAPVWYLGRSYQLVRQRHA